MVTAHRQCFMICIPGIQGMGAVRTGNQNQLNVTTSEIINGSWKFPSQAAILAAFDSCGKDDKVAIAFRQWTSTSVRKRYTGIC